MSLLMVDLTGLGGGDAVVVDALARVQLAARRSGCEICLRHVPTELQDLICLMGLENVLRVEAARHPE